ncbi:hypothetical protein EW146_g4591 [Bondarzewia mesenterica]|uniref:Uncharacterized protein n=1 Tax=Bondarzewia mesenterica TaxID=1095465 RepID=A0A4S4LV54_9AGAM|nr:hypothetical protein EW146_g4591 [Bondarzewia mesenterica]
MVSAYAYPPCVVDTSGQQVMPKIKECEKKSKEERGRDERPLGACQPINTASSSFVDSSATHQPTSPSQMCNAQVEHAGHSMPSSGPGIGQRLSGASRSGSRARARNPASAGSATAAVPARPVALLA